LVRGGRANKSKVHPNEVY